MAHETTTLRGILLAFAATFALSFVAVRASLSQEGGRTPAPARSSPSPSPVEPSAPPAARGPAHLPPALADLGAGHEVRLVYFVARDRTPTARHEEKIAAVMAVVADLYRESLAAHGIPTRGLDFEFAKEGPARPLVHTLRGKHPAAHYSGAPDYDGMRQWREIVPEVEEALGPASRSLYVVFAETYDPGPSEIEWPGGVALGARYSEDGGVGVFSAWILRDEVCAPSIDALVRMLADASPVPGRVANDCRVMNAPRFELMEDGIGAVAHELGHALGLPHDMRVDPTDCIMGNGFRHLRCNYWPALGAGERAVFSRESALLLARSRFLAPDPGGPGRDAVAIEARLLSSPRGGGHRVRLAIRASDPRALDALVVRDCGADVHLFSKRLSGTSASEEVLVRLARSLHGEEAVTLEVIATGRAGGMGQAHVEVRCGP